MANEGKVAQALGRALLRRYGGYRPDSLWTHKRNEITCVAGGNDSRSERRRGTDQLPQAAAVAVAAPPLAHLRMATRTRLPTEDCQVLGD